MLSSPSAAIVGVMQTDLNDAPSTQCELGIAPVRSRSSHSVTSTECDDRESEVTGINPGSQEHRRGRDIAPMDGMNVLSGLCTLTTY